MGVIEAVAKRRTIRRFKEKEIPFSALQKCIDAARLSPTARNFQPLEFLIVQAKENRQKVLECLSFGGIVKEKGMRKGEEPKAYIIVLLNKQKAYDYSFNDTGLAVQSIVLTALEQGIGSCIIGAVNREKLMPLLGIPGHCEITLVVALGYPKEKPKIVEADDKMQYWVEKNTLVVPKRSLKSVLHKEKY